MSKHPDRVEEALEYHRRERRGKIAVCATKPCRTQRDLSLAYTPGVAEPCRLIHKDPECVYEFTNKGNLVAVVSNGTAVLGLGNLGAAAGKPVMEGKGVLFKRFADIDVYDINLDSEDPEEIIQAVRLMAPTFGGINLEDIKAPECFEIESRLQALLPIPVFHDDQHGTAIISGAALLNALEVAGKAIDQVRVVFNGAGAAGLACARFWRELGVPADHITMCDIHGVVFKGRSAGMNPWLEVFARDTSMRTLEEAISGADVFCGLSVGGVVSAEMLQSMAPRPIVFAMANPDPEIGYEEARAARDDVIVATGRSDYPNQVNNVLGFPFLFRGALDVRAREINLPMKLAAARALARLARSEVPASVRQAYGMEDLHFGPEYIIPKPFDDRVLYHVAPAVARAAIESGVSQVQPKDLEAWLAEYRSGLIRRLGPRHELMMRVTRRLGETPVSVLLVDDQPSRVKAAARQLQEEGLVQPLLPVLDDPALQELDVLTDGLAAAAVLCGGDYAARLRGLLRHAEEQGRPFMAQLTLVCAPSRTLLVCAPTAPRCESALAWGEQLGEAAAQVVDFALELGYRPRLSVFLSTRASRQRVPCIAGAAASAGAFPGSGRAHGSRTG